MDKQHPPPRTRRATSKVEGRSRAEQQPRTGEIRGKEEWQSNQSQQPELEQALKGLTAFSRRKGSAQYF